MRALKISSPPQMDMALSQKEIRQNFIRRRRENQLCLKCGKKLLENENIYCADCRIKVNKTNNERREWYRNAKICPRCGKNDLCGDEKICLECQAKGYDTTMKSRQKLGKEHYNKIHANWARNEHQRRIESGICTRCGKRKADHGFKTCGICRAKIRESKRTKDYKPKRAERYEYGLCYFCDNPVKEGYKVCEEHYAQCLKRLDNVKSAEVREQFKRENNIFFKGNKRRGYE